MWNIWNTRWIRCKGSCLQLLGFWNFFVFFQFFPLKLVYFWTKRRKNIYGGFFHSILATIFNYGIKNNGRTKESTLKTQNFAVFDLRFYGKVKNIFMDVFIVLWSCLFTTKLKSVIRHNLGHSKQDCSRLYWLVCNKSWTSRASGWKTMQARFRTEAFG